jgi:hypothetical protein
LVSMVHMVMVWSTLPVASVVLSGLQAMAVV